MECVACRPPGRLQDWKRRYASSTVRCKLGRICPHPELIKEIQICARLLWKEVHHRSLGSRELPRTPPVRGARTFFTPCCRIVSRGLRRGDQVRLGDLYVSAVAFLEDTHTYGSDDITKIDSLHVEAGGLMSVNAINMVVTQFRKRFTLFMQLWHGISAEGTSKIVRACYSSDASVPRAVLEMKEWLGSEALGCGR